MDESGACSARMSAHADTLSAVLTKKLRVGCRRRSARSAAVEVTRQGGRTGIHRGKQTVPLGHRDAVGSLESAGGRRRASVDCRAEPNTRPEDGVFQFLRLRLVIS